MYTSQTDICDGVLRPGIDFVYARSRLGNQDSIVQILNQKIKGVTNVISDHNDKCVNLVFRVFYHFYLPPCGNSTHLTPPSSICQEECEMVRTECQKTWDALQLAFMSMGHVIECNESSSLLFPLPHCCTGAGLGDPSLHFTSTVAAVASTSQTRSPGSVSNLYEEYIPREMIDVAGGERRSGMECGWSSGLHPGSSSGSGDSSTPHCILHEVA